MISIDFNSVDWASDYNVERENQKRSARHLVTKLTARMQRATKVEKVARYRQRIAKAQQTLDAIAMAEKLEAE